MSTQMEHTEPGFNEAELVRKIVKGADDAFEFLARSYGGRMLTVARRITRNEADAYDCLQEALLKCFTSMGQFQGRSGLGAWLHRITVNAALMRLRSRNRSHEDSLDELLPAFDPQGMRTEDAPLSDAEEIEARYEQRQTQAAVRVAIDRLPDEYRAIIIARDIESLTIAETAEVLNVSHSLVKTRLHRGRAALKRLLDPVVQAAPACRDAP